MSTAVTASGAEHDPAHEEIERDRYERSSRAYRLLVDLERVVAGSLLVSVLGLILVQVFTRYVLNHPLTWSEELARLLLVWCAFLSAGYVASRNAHISVDLLAAILPRRWGGAIGIIAMALVVLASAFMVYAGVQLVLLTRILALPATGLSKALLYAAVLVGFLMIMVHTALNIVLYLRHPDEMPDAVEKAAAMEGL